jgi:peptidoglycan/LPS O-acetylase OafA/YrhL
MKAPERNFPKGYLPTLDGWRAVAILAVLLNHDKLHRIGRFGLDLIHWEGGHGVDLFFAISGILICTRLLEEEQLNGAINLKAFYIRRLFRIQPAALVYLAVISLLMVFQALDRAPKDVLFAALMVRNYLPFDQSPHAWYTKHFWSLAVEEHFYLLLPGFLFLVRKNRIAILGAIVFMLAIWRAIVLEHVQLQFGWSLNLRTDLAVGGILLASLVALLLRNPDVRGWMHRWVRPWVTMPLVVAVGLWVHHQKGELSFLGLQCIFPLLVVSTLLRPASITGRILELPPVRFVGRISYSIYLWQMLFFPFWAFVTPPHSILLDQIQGSWLRYAALLGVSLLSYYCIEKPMVRIGHRLAKSPVPSRGQFNVLEDAIIGFQGARPVQPGDH